MTPAASSTQSIRANADDILSGE